MYCFIAFHVSPLIIIESTSRKECSLKRTLQGDLMVLGPKPKTPKGAWKKRPSVLPSETSDRVLIYFLDYLMLLSCLKTYQVQSPLYAFSFFHNSHQWISKNLSTVAKGRKQQEDPEKTLAQVVEVLRICYGFAREGSDCFVEEFMLKHLLFWPFHVVLCTRSPNPHLWFSWELPLIRRQWNGKAENSL